MQSSSSATAADVSDAAVSFHYYYLFIFINFFFLPRLVIFLKMSVWTQKLLSRDNIARVHPV